MNPYKILYDRAKEVAASIEVLAQDFRDTIDRRPNVGDDDNKAPSTLTSLLVGFYFLKQSYEEIDAARKTFYKITDTFDKATVPEALDNAGMEKVALSSLGKSFYPLIKYSASMVDKTEGYVWLKANGGEDLISETVNASTLATFLKEKLLEEGVEAPSELIKFTSYKTTGMSTFKPKG